MRRKPSSSNNGGGGYNNQHRKPRFQSGGGGGGGHNHGGGHNRPRKNYTALREKYLAQARDALAAGDRVLAENYFQHSDHCYRMMVEEGYNPRHQQQQQNAQAGDDAAPQEGATVEGAQENGGDNNQDNVEAIPENLNVLPAFLTVNYDGAQQAANESTPPPAQNWEERDA